MNQNQLYFPNHEKWIKYYEHIGTTEHPVYFRTGNRKSSGVTGGSIGKRGESRIIPIETVKHNDSVDRSEMKVELVSPVQQVIDQAASEIKREKTIKRPSSSCPKQSTKRKQRKTSSLRGKNDGNQF